MNLFSFITDAKISLEILDGAGDNETIYGTGVDMAKYKHVVFIGAVLKGEIMANSMKVQQDSDSAFGTAADLLGTSVSLATTASADALAMVEVKNVQKRYVRPALIIANWTTPTPVCVIGIRWGRTQYPDTNTGSESHVAPAQGTA
jgi:hypothetical protein